MTSRIPALVTLIAAFAAASCTDHEQTSAAERAPVAVRVTHVAEELLASSFDAGGTVRAQTIAPLSSRIMSPVVEVHARPGMRVTRGQRLITLDSRQLTATAAAADATLEAALRGAAAAEAEEGAAEAALALARTTHGRIESLRARNSATQGELDEAIANLRAAEARLDAAKARRAEVASAIDAARSAADAARATGGYAVITAPFDGLVTEVPAQAGALAAPGVPLVVVEDPRRYRLEVSVDAARARAITVGAPAGIDIAGAETMTGTVAEVTESLDPAAHSFLVKIDIPDTSGLRSGLFGKATFAGASAPGIAIPASALVRRGQLAFAFVEADGVARMRVVHPGDRVGDRVRVLAGVDPGDRVIVNPPPGLLDGTPVTTGDGGQR